MGNAASSVPYGAQSNAVHLALTCSFDPSGSTIYDTAISLTAPLSGGAGQQVSISDVAAKILLPAEFLVTILDSSADSYVANTSITFDVTNASPQLFVVNEYNTQHNISFNNAPSDQDRVINFPAAGETENGVLPPIGPITLGQPGQADFRLRAVNFQLQAFRSGIALFQNSAQISCNPSPEYVLASIVVDNSEVGPLLAPANNAPGNAPALGLGQHSTIASIPVNCTENVINPTRLTLNNTFNYTFSAIAPARLTNGKAFNLTNVNNYVTVPGQNAYYSTALYGSGTCGLFTRLLPQNGLPGLGLAYLNASPGTVDVSNTFTASDASTPNPLVTGRYVDCQNQSPVVFPFPNLGYLELPSVVPSNQSGSAFSVSFTDIQGIVEGYNTYFGYSGSENWICTPFVQPILLSAPIV